MSEKDEHKPDHEFNAMSDEAGNYSSLARGKPQPGVEQTADLKNVKAPIVDAEALTWDLVISDCGLLETRSPIKADGYGTPADNGVYPFGINGYDWELGGFSYLGETKRLPSPTRSGVTVWHIVYTEADAMHGNAKMPDVPCNVFIDNEECWVRNKSTKVWTKVQSYPACSPQTTWYTTAQQQGSFQLPAPVLQPDGSWKEPAPTAMAYPGRCNHGWPQCRGGFPAGTVDGVFSMYRIWVDQDNANKISSQGIDWWETPTSGGNIGYSQGPWRRLSKKKQWMVNCCVPQDQLRANPPPPLVGIPEHPGSNPVPPDPEPSSGDSIEISVDGNVLGDGSMVTFKVKKATTKTT